MSSSALNRNAFARTKFSGGFIDRREQGCLFLNIRNIGLNLLTKPNQFADFANLLTSFVCPRTSPCG